MKENSFITYCHYRCPQMISELHRQANDGQKRPDDPDDLDECFDICSDLWDNSCIVEYVHHYHGTAESRVWRFRCIFHNIHINFYHQILLCTDYLQFCNTISRPYIQTWSYFGHSDHKNRGCYMDSLSSYCKIKLN